MDLLRDSILIIGIPREYHDTLSKWAAEHNLKNLAHTATVEIMAVEAICEYINRIEQMEMAVRPSDENATHALEPSGHNPDGFVKFEGSLSSPENSQE